MKRATSTARFSRLPPALALAMAAGGLLVLPGCESGFDRNDQIVNSLRILGARTHVADSTDGIDWADADVGDTIELSALVANPGNDPSLTVTWLGCVPIPGQVSPCTYAPDLRQPTDLIPMADDPTTGVILLGVGTEIEYTIPAELEPLLMALITRAQQNVNAECGIYLQIPLVVIAQTTTQTFTAAKNIRLSPWKEIGMNSSDPTLQFYERNANPVAGGLVIPASLDLCQGQSLTTACLTDGDCAAVGGTCQQNYCTGTPTFPSGLQTVCVPVGQAQSYYDCDLDGPVIDYPGEGPNLPEEPDVTWYMTGGSLASLGGSDNGGTPSDLTRLFTDFTRPSGPFTLYAVVRDGRDGEDWIAQDFQ